MTREQYIKTLEKKLKRLPKEDREEAINYYNEYFDEAGSENEEKVMEELGTPEEVANNILIHVIDKQFEENEAEKERQKSKEKKKVKVSVGWLIILGLFALPMSPVAIALMICLFVLVACLYIAVGSIIFAACICVIAGIISLFAGVFVLVMNLANGLIVLGSALVLTSVAYMLFYMFVKLWMMLTKGMICLGMKILKKKNRDAKEA